VLLRVATENSIVATEKLLRNFFVVWRSRVLVICSMYGVEQERGNCKVLNF
jgi:hypothetical protein